MKRIGILQSIIGLVFAAYIHVQAQNPPGELPRRATSLNLSLGYELYATSNFNSMLQEHGYPAIPEFSPLPWIGAEMSFYQFDRRIITSTRVRMRLIDFDTDAWVNRLISTVGSVDVGYMFIQNRNLVLYLAGGGMFGSTSITMAPRDRNIEEVENLLDSSSAPGRGLALQTLHVGVHANAGVDFIFYHDEKNNKGYTVGINLGSPIIDINDWKLNGIGARGLDMQTSGFHAALSLGVMLM